MIINQLLTFLACAGVASASYANNLNYRSPSHHHPGLGLSIHKVNKRNAGSAPYPASQLNFTHGVASGDPYPASVILWTRCAPMSDDDRSNVTVSGYVPLYNPVPIYGSANDTGPPSTSPVCLTYKVSTDRNLASTADSGTVYTSSDTDYTVKVRFEDQVCMRTGLTDVVFRSKLPVSARIPSTTTSSASAAPPTSRALSGAPRPRLLLLIW